MHPRRYKLASFFAGIGGIDLGFYYQGFDTVYANDFDKHAIDVYKEQFYSAPNPICDDIFNIDINEIPDVDIITAGFPCQPFSVAGLKKGFEDPRGQVFLRLMEIIKAKNPKVVFLENVKNLVTHNDGKSFEKVIRHLTDLGYKTKHFVLNAADITSTPQNRERVYIIGMKSENYHKLQEPRPCKRQTPLEAILEPSESVPERYYYVPTWKDYNLLKNAIKRRDTFYQYRRTYVRENKSNLCPTLTANMGTGGHNVPLILTSDNRIRKLTPRECFRLQGFEDDHFYIPQISDCHLYKQAGNSVCVGVIEKLAKQIRKVLDEDRRLQNPNQR